MVAGLHPEVGERVREPGRALVELAVGHLAAGVDEGEAVGHLVDGELEQVGEVEVTRGHRPKIEHVPLAERTRARPRAVRQEQVGRGGEVLVDPVGAVDAAHPAVQRREPHLHEDARDPHLALGRGPPFGRVDRARDDRRS